MKEVFSPSREKGTFYDSIKRAAEEEASFVPCLPEWQWRDYECHERISPAMFHWKNVRDLA